MILDYEEFENALNYWTIVYAQKYKYDKDDLRAYVLSSKLRP